MIFCFRWFFVSDDVSALLKHPFFGRRRQAEAFFIEHTVRK